jgi:four helix bundle protein
MSEDGNYKNLIVWQKSIVLVKQIYLLTQKFPPEEKFGLISQMRRAVVSVPSNIAEG